MSPEDFKLLWAGIEGYAVVHKMRAVTQKWPLVRFMSLGQGSSPATFPNETRNPALPR
jgi:hypothetical protein